MPTKRRPYTMLSATVAATIALAGCGDTTPIAQCYYAAASLEIVQTAILPVVQMDRLEGTKAKQVLKEISARGTDAAVQCSAAAKRSDGEKVSYYIGLIQGAVSVGGRIAADILSDQALEEATGTKPEATGLYAPATQSGFTLPSDAKDADGMQHAVLRYLNTSQPEGALLAKAKPLPAENPPWRTFGYFDDAPSRAAKRRDAEHGHQHANTTVVTSSTTSTHQ